MNRLKLPTLLAGAVLLLSACGGTSAGPDVPGPDPGGPIDVDPVACRVTVNRDLTVPTLLANGPEACDYWFPGTAGSHTAYRIASDVLIEPGTVLLFGQDTHLYVEDSGRLTAIGTEDERIVFQGAEPVHGYWYGICFEDSRESRLEFVDIRWGGKVWTSMGSNCRGGIAGAWPGSTEPLHITNSTVSGSYVSGLSVHDLILGDFANNAFYNNLEYGVAADASQVRNLDAASDYLGTDFGATNGKPYVYAGGVFTDPGENHIWSNLNAPYFVAESERYVYTPDIEIYGPTNLILEAGTTIVFDGDSELYVRGGAGIGMGGTTASPVVLTGLRPERGSWNGVHIDSSAAILQNVEIHWAGRDTPFFTGSLVLVDVVDNPAVNSVDNVFIDGSENCAVVLWDSAESQFDTFDVRYGSNNEQNLCRR